jgi:hypothetical protein
MQDSSTFHRINCNTSSTKPSNLHVGAKRKVVDGDYPADSAKRFKSSGPNQTTRTEGVKVKNIKAFRSYDQFNTTT